jgi:redox-sensitive bicupin YhaK (pirin superfamily)
MVNDAVSIPADSFAILENDGEQFTLKASENAVVLILSGQPLNEPIANQV